MTMLTVDTHHAEGYICDLCEEKYDNKTANVVACTDQQIVDFIQWCKTQDFYKDTVIVIVGDHPRMDDCLVENIDYYNRTIYNCIINSDTKVRGEMKNRIFTPMDLFPTVLSAIGFEYEGERLGLGTNMFSGEPTLAEELGYDIFDTELGRHSNYYLKYFQ